MNNFLETMKQEQNYTLTENGAITHISTNNKVLDLFSMGVSMRNRTDQDCINIFREAYYENKELAMKCLFYIRDIRGGQGERRFFRICYSWLIKEDKQIALSNMHLIPMFGRWDDMYIFVDTELENYAFKIMYDQFKEDMSTDFPSLLGKWLKSENASSFETKRLAKKTRQAFKMTQSEYRKALSELRSKINIVEKLMSENRWDEIEFDKVPSRAGMIYRNAFANRDETKERYAIFAANKNTKVNASVLYPYEIVEKALNWSDETERNIIDKYWENIPDWFANSTFDALCVVDTSGSMRGRPMDVAISLGLYCAERNKGPFHNHYISFSRRPELIEVKGKDFVEKVNYICSKNLCENTNIEATFDLILRTALANKEARNNLPKNLIIISDMNFDMARSDNVWRAEISSIDTLMESIKKKWDAAGICMPNLIFWNVDARQNNIPMLGNNISFVSGFSPVIFKTLMTNKTGYELMLETLNSSRYDVVTLCLRHSEVVFQ